MGIPLPTHIHLDCCLVHLVADSTQLVGCIARTDFCPLAPQLVNVLCAEMTTAFRAKSVSLPPWRALRSMRSKWCPTASRDVVVAPSPRNGTKPPSPVAGRLPVLRSASRAAAAAAAASVASAADSMAEIRPSPKSGDGGSGCSGSGESLGSKDSVLPAHVPPLLPVDRKGHDAGKAAAAPWKVQTGFHVFSGASLLPQHLVAAPTAEGSSALASAAPSWSVCDPFDKWGAHGKRRASVEHVAAKPPLLRFADRQRQQQRPLETMPAIRTVKMSGRSRA